jgi:hypothetical protein
MAEEARQARDSTVLVIPRPTLAAAAERELQDNLLVL